MKKIMRSEKMMKRVLTIALSLAMVVSMFTVIPPQEAEAKGSMAEGQSVNTILVYGRNTDGQDVLLSQLDVADMVDYMNDHMSELGRVHNYSIIDRYPTVVHQEAQGFYVYDLLDYAIVNSTSSDVRAQDDHYFGDSEDGDHVLFATFDSGGRYSEDWTYDELYGTPRYNFPKIYEYWNYNYKATDSSSLRYTDIDQIWYNREDEEVLLSITAFSQRYIQTDEKYKADETDSDKYNMESYWDSLGYLDTLKTMRLMLPMTEDELRNATPTASDSRYGINNILFDLEDDLTITADEVAKPTWEVIDGEADENLDDDYYYVKLSCETEGATIYYDPLLNGGSSPTMKYEDGTAIQVCRKNADWTPFRIRAVKDGCSDAGEVSVTKPSGDDPYTPVEGASVWDGETYDTSWYDGHEDEDSYELTSAAQLAGLAWLVNGRGLSEQTINDFAGKTITLKTDVDLANKPWDPIGRDMNCFSSFYNRVDWGSYYQFSGTFDGDGHTVSGLTMNQDALRDTYQGMFGKVVGATIKNLTVDGKVQVPDMAYCAGGIVGYITIDEEDEAAEEPNQGRTYIINCHNKAFINCSPAGGVAGKIAGKATIENCTNEGTINGHTAGMKGPGVSGAGVLGGIAGEISSFHGEISRCVNNGKVYYGSTMGGIVGNAGYYGIIKDCVNKGDINEKEKIQQDKTIGGINGYGGIIENCDNQGTIQTEWPANVGGINGTMATAITNCRNKGCVLVNLPSSELGDTYAGGISGFAAKDVMDCINFGSVRLRSGYACMGGLLGKSEEGSTNSIVGCLNLGDVIAEGDAEGYISGLVYSNTSDTIINHCMNMGRVLSYSKEAALVYFLSGKTIISYCLDVSHKALFGRESSYYGQPEYEGIYYLTDGVQFDVTPEVKKEGISEMTLEEMRDPAFAEALGERYIAASGSYPLLKKYVCEIQLNTEDGTEMAVRDVFGNEILGDGVGNYTLYEGGTYSYEVSKEGYVTAKKEFKPEKDGQITVALEQLKLADVSNATYTGKAVEPKLTVSYGEGDQKKTLTEGKDYTVSFRNNTNVGTASATVQGIGEYEGGVASTTFRIKPASIGSATLKKTSLAYNGKVKKLSVTVKAKIGRATKTLKSGTDYIVTYKNNKNVGKATVTITGKGNYTGTITKTFKINPKGAALSKVTKAKKAATVKWKKQTKKMSSSRITGYQVQVATNKAFTKGKKTVTVKGYKKVSKKVTKLKAKKKYYVRVRTYKTVSGVKFYSPWSKVKSVRTR